MPPTDWIRALPTQLGRGLGRLSSRSDPVITVENRLRVATIPHKKAIPVESATVSTTRTLTSLRPSPKCHVTLRRHRTSFDDWYTFSTGHREVKHLLWCTNRQDTTTTNQMLIDSFSGPYATAFAYARKLQVGSAHVQNAMKGTSVLRAHAAPFASKSAVGSPEPGWCHGQRYPRLRPGRC